MEDIKKEMGNGQKCDSCSSHGLGCLMHGWHGLHGHYLLRWFLGLVILLAVFYFGFKLGELKSWFEAGIDSYGGDFMMGGSRSFHRGYRGDYYVPQMMNNSYENQATPTPK